MSRPTSRSRLAVLAVLPALVGLATPAAAATGSEPADPYGLTCGGRTVDDSSPVRYRTATFIEAPLDVVWDVQTDVAHWPSWQEAVLGVARDDAGELRPGSVFHWQTPAPATATTPATTLQITSTVQQVENERCLRWTGPAEGEGLRIDEGVHVWNFVPVEGGVLVRTEETWTGAQAEADPALSTELLGAGLEAWLTDLTTAAEAAATAPGHGCHVPAS